MAPRAPLFPPEAVSDQDIANEVRELTFLLSRSRLSVRAIAKAIIGLESGLRAPQRMNPTSLWTPASAASLRAPAPVAPRPSPPPPSSRRRTGGAPSRERRTARYKQRKADEASAGAPWSGAR